MTTFRGNLSGELYGPYNSAIADARKWFVLGFKTALRFVVD